MWVASGRAEKEKKKTAVDVVDLVVEGASSVRKRTVAAKKKSIRLLHVKKPRTRRTRFTVMDSEDEEASSDALDDPNDEDYVQEEASSGRRPSSIAVEIRGSEAESEETVEDEMMQRMLREKTRSNGHLMPSALRIVDGSDVEEESSDTPSDPDDTNYVGSIEDPGEAEEELDADGEGEDIATGSVSDHSRRSEQDAAAESSDRSLSSSASGDRSSDADWEQ